jgi:dihydrolipoamide dehydrogenase
MNIELKVPDIGDFSAIPVIEILIKVGDTVAVEQSLVSLESDKATMEVPASHAGVVREIKVALGDKVSKGSVVAVIEAVAITAAPVTAPVIAPPVIAPVAVAATADAVDLVVLGAGPGGYSAAFRAADLGLNVVLIERYPTLGGVCLNVGCIPSKALLHVAAVMDETKHFADLGIHFEPPRIELPKLLAHKNKVVGKLTGGLAGMAKLRKVTVVQGTAQFASSHSLTVTKPDGSSQTLAFKHCIIAAGSQPLHLPFLPKDERIVDSTGALELKSVPAKMLIIGGGIIGLEMGTVYSTLGSRLDVVEMLPGLMPGADRDLVAVWTKINKHRFDNLMLNTKTVAAEAKPDGIWVTFEGENAPKEPQRYDLVLEAVGRAPNGKKLNAEAAGVAVNERGFITVDNQMRSNVPHIFAIGDIVGQPMLAHKAVHEAHVAAEVVAGHKAYFDARQIPSVAYTDPEIAWAGLTEEQCKAQGIAYDKGLFPWAASGRAIANGRDEGFTKLLFDASTKRIIGGGVVGTHAGDLISEVCLAIEMGADSVDIGKTIHPHPTLGESIGMAAEAALGHCTDLPPSRRR